MVDSDFDHQLRSLLEEEQTSIPDAGFSQRVVATLPKRSARRVPREAIILGMTLTGCWLGLIVLPGGEFLHELLARLPRARSISSLPVPWLILVYTLCWTAVASVLERRKPTDSTSPASVRRA